MGEYYVWVGNKWLPEESYIKAIKSGELSLYLVSSNTQRLVLAKNPAEAGKAFERIQYDDAVVNQIESVLQVEKPSDVDAFDRDATVPVVGLQCVEPTVTQVIHAVFPETKKKQLRDEATKAHNKAVIELEDKIRALNKKLDQTLESIDKE
jgi:hypothetical protein